MAAHQPPHDRAKSQLAQLVGEVLIHQAPHTAKINTDETRRQVDEWLDGFEAHAARFVGPFLQQVLDNSDPPDAVKALLQEAIQPTAAFTSLIEQVFLYGIVQSVIGLATTPFLYGLSSDLNTTAVDAGSHRPIDPSVLATAAARGLNPKGPYTLTVSQDVLDEAKKSGVGSDGMNLLASVVGLPPALQELFEMKRRGIIDSPDAEFPNLTVALGLKEGDFRDEWIAAVQGLAHAYLTPIDFGRAAVQAQLDYATARTWANKTGLDTSTPVGVATGTGPITDDMFGLLYAISGRPPGPEELARMVHRGIIQQNGEGADVLSFQQGIAESDVKTKWTDKLFLLSQYVPAPETTATLLERGGLTPAQAAAYWHDFGLDDATIAALTYVTEQQHVTQDKLLAKGEITKGYYDGIFTNAQATELLGLLGYRGEVAAEILEIQDFRRQIRAIDQVVRRIGTLYETFKISAVDALAALAAVGLPQAEQQALLGTWQLLRIAPVRVPTPTEIGRAVKAGTITQAEGLAELAALGYQPRDAAIVLSSESGAAVVPLPPAGTTTTG